MGVYGNSFMEDGQDEGKKNPIHERIQGVQILVIIGFDLYFLSFCDLKDLSNNLQKSRMIVYTIRSWCFASLHTWYCVCLTDMININNGYGIRYIWFLHSLKLYTQIVVALFLRVYIHFCRIQLNMTEVFFGWERTVVNKYKFSQF